MGSEICKNCNSNASIYTEKNLSNNKNKENEDGFKQLKHLINQKNKINRFESNISTNFNYNENEISNYDNPLYNTSLEESMNLGNCYIGTNKNHTRVKPYDPDNSIQTMVNKKRLSIGSNLNQKDFSFDNKMNKTSKNFNKKNIRYNLLFKTGNNEIVDSKILDKKINFNINRKNNKKDDKIKICNNTAQTNLKIDKTLENINKLIKRINTNNTNNNNNIQKNKTSDLSEKVPESSDEKNLDKLKIINLKYNIKIFKKIISKIITNKKKKNDIHERNKKIEINQYSEEYESSNSENNLDELDVNLIPEKKYIFIGTKINNLKDGFGLEIFKNSNSFYSGLFVNGKHMGFCKYIINNQKLSYKYEGEVEDIHASGYGLYINKETEIKYEGEWKNSLKNGIGIEKYKNNVYKGNFVNGRRNGIGEYFWDKDVYYIGEWIDNYMNGTGIYYFNKNAWYEGSFKDNKMEGFGILNVKYNKIYAGFFKKDFKNGFGIKIWDKEKKAYVGFWKNNKQDGFGKFFEKDKIKYAIYKDGNVINEVKDNLRINMIYNDINKYFSLLFELRNYNEVKKKVYEFLNM